MQSGLGMPGSFTVGEPFDSEINAEEEKIQVIQPENEVMKIAMGKGYAIYDNQSSYLSSATHNEAIGDGSIIEEMQSSNDLKSLVPSGDCLAHLVDEYVTKKGDIYKYLKQVLTMFPDYAAENDELSEYMASYQRVNRTILRQETGHTQASRPQTDEELRQARIRALDKTNHASEDTASTGVEFVYSTTASDASSETCTMSSQGHATYNSSSSYYRVAAKFDGATHNRAQGGGRIGRERRDDDALLKEQYRNYSEARRAGALFGLFKKHLKRDDLG
ncbi:hypothetical protein NMY22_g13153 [Coprinellus aureogranulatus]|nr:hypothetical protein NMY22_g13153 [Coprinellus aureogranulatus]